MRAKIIVVMAMGLVLAFSGVAYATLSSDTHPHNMVTEVGTLDEVCKFCHAPHNVAEVPLWNHSDSAATFTMYGTTVAGNSPDATPNENSLRCLSCHDGVTALDAIGGTTGTAGKDMTTLYPSSTALIGVDLTDDHPVSIGTGGITGFVQATAETAGIVFYSSKVECGSCHDPHEEATSYFLRFDNTDSDLCFACHQDK